MLKDPNSTEVQTKFSVAGHPADDILHFLYSSTSKSFRDIYEDLCLRTYFTVFKVGYQTIYK